MKKERRMNTVKLRVVILLIEMLIFRESSRDLENLLVISISK